ncbi:hypothetical protein QTP88_028752 [Uroleucon formosanum]
MNGGRCFRGCRLRVRHRTAPTERAASRAIEFRPTLKHVKSALVALVRIDRFRSTPPHHPRRLTDCTNRAANTRTATDPYTFHHYRLPDQTVTHDTLTTRQKSSVDNDLFFDR